MVDMQGTAALIQRRPPPSPLERGQRALLFALLALTATAWALTIWHTRAMPMAPGGIGHDVEAHSLVWPRMKEAAHLAASGMAGAGWSLTGFAAFVITWAVMMAAMMFPGLAPMLFTMHAIARFREGDRGALRTTAVFVSGYLLVWTAVGGILWAMAQAAGRLGTQFDLGRHVAWPPLVIGGALMVAGLYQFTPFKQRCLDHCRSPFIVVMQRWREGNRGAFQMGLGHGLFCLGCCWALFTVLVTAGIMSLAWMLALTLIDFAEKTLPAGRRVSGIIGFGLLALGVTIATGLAGPI